MSVHQNSLSTDLSSKKLPKPNSGGILENSGKPQAKFIGNVNPNLTSKNSTSVKKKLEDELDPDISESPNFKTLDTKKAGYSADITKGSMIRTTVSSTKSNVSRSLDLTPNFYESLKDLIESDNSDKKLTYVETENNKLRAHLKDLNEKLTKFLTVSKIADAKPKRYPEFKDKTEDEQLTTINQEMANNAKILEIKTIEYNKLKDRVDKLKDPLFVVQLEDEIQQTKSKIEKVKRENVKLAHETSTTGKNLNNIENVNGIPDNIREANEKAREIIMLRRKLEIVKEKNEKFAEEHKTKSAKAQELTTKIDSSNHPTQPSAKLIERYEELLKQSQRLEEGVKVLNLGREAANKAKFKKAINELELAVKKDKEFVAKLEEMISQQSYELKSMLDKESLSTDKNSSDVFSKLKGSMEGNSASRSEFKASADEKRVEQKKAEPKKIETKPKVEAKPKQEAKPEPEIKKEEPKEIKKFQKEASKANIINSRASGSPERIDEDINVEEAKKLEKARKSPVKELAQVREVRDVKDLKAMKSPEQKDAMSTDFKKDPNLKIPERTSPSPLKDKNQKIEDLQLPSFTKKDQEKQERPTHDEKLNNSKEELVLNDEFKPKKKKTVKEQEPEFEIKPKEEKEINDPFAKFDNIDPLELTKNKNIAKPTKDTIGDSEAKPARKRREEKEELPSDTQFETVPVDTTEKKKKRRTLEDDDDGLLPIEDDSPKKKEEVFDLTKAKEEVKRKPTQKLEKLEMHEKKNTSINDTNIKDSSKKEVKSNNDFFEDLDV